jgi:concanavalin A-like lectin/glucanase superfamily protein
MKVMNTNRRMVTAAGHSQCQVFTPSDAKGKEIKLNNVLDRTSITFRWFIFLTKSIQNPIPTPMQKLYILLFLALSTSAKSQTNYALTFNGTSNCVNVGNPIPSSSSYTKEAWVYLTNSTGPRNIISSQDVPLWVEDGILKAGQGGNYSLVTGGTISLNRWVHTAVTYDVVSGIMKLYRDGIKVGETTVLAPYITQTTFIGSHFGTAAYWQGGIDEVRIWGRALTEIEIKTNMLRGPAVNATGLIEYYKFNEGSGLVLNNSSLNPGGAHGSITGGTWIASPIIISANALSLDGVNDYMDIGNSIALKPSTAVTNEVWIKSSNFSAAGLQQITSNFENGGYGLSLNAGKLQWELRASSSGTYLVVEYPTSSMTNNTWYHVAGTFDGSFMRLFVNGVEVSSLSLGGSGRTLVYNNPGNNMMIGAEASAGTAPVAGAYFNGQLDELRIWNVAHNASQIQATMNIELNAGDATQTAGLVAYYTFNQGNTNGTNTSLTTVTDHKGNNNGTLFNLALTGTSSNYTPQQPSLIILPVVWKSFTVRAQAGKSLLQWSTAREVNTAQFGVEHSVDGFSYLNIGNVAGAGNSNADKKYTYVHASPTIGANYYRLAQRDNDGKVTYSETRKIQIAHEVKSFVLQNNVVNNKVLSITINKPVTLSLFTGDGQLLLKKSFTPGTHVMEMGNYSKGMYWLSATGITERVMVY